MKFNEKCRNTSSILVQGIYDNVFCQPDYFLKILKRIVLILSYVLNRSTRKSLIFFVRVV